MNWKSKDYLYYKIIQFYLENKIEPGIDLEDLCKSKGWHLVPYPKEKLQIFKSISKDGFTIKDNNDFFIFYNPELKESCYGRFRFTIAHEIGHIYLYHHIFVDDYVLMSGGDIKGIWEQQANIFAQNLLMPVNYKSFYRSNSTSSITEKFCVSSSMVNTRLNKLYKDELFIRKAIKNLKSR